jgi:hypothetical protein
VVAGVFEAMFKELLRFYDVKKGIQWNWASMDAAIVKAPKGGLLQARTRRTAPREAARGTSRSTVVASRLA